MIRRAIERWALAVPVWARPIVAFTFAALMACLSSASVTLAVDAWQSGHAPIAGLASALALYTAVRAVQVLAISCSLGR